MSKQSEAKQAQGYNTTPKNCGTCKNRVCTKVLMSWMEKDNALYGNRYFVDIHGNESKQRCGIGGFAIKKSAICDRWELAP